MPSIRNANGAISAWVIWTFRTVWIVIAALVVAGAYLVGWSETAGSGSFGAICWSLAAILLTFFSPRIIDDD